MKTKKYIYSFIIIVIFSLNYCKGDSPDVNNNVPQGCWEQFVPKSKDPNIIISDTWLYICNCDDIIVSFIINEQATNYIIRDGKINSSSNNTMKILYLDENLELKTMYLIYKYEDDKFYFNFNTSDYPDNYENSYTNFLGENAICGPYVKSEKTCEEIKSNE